jgi:hypothetical protein
MAKKSKEPDLIGIDQIAEFCIDLSHATLLNLSFYYGFPIFKDNSGLIWMGRSKDLLKWLKERGFRRWQDVSESGLRKFKHQQKQKKGPQKFFNKTLKDPDTIARFFNITPGMVINHFNNYPDCPIRKGKDGRWTVDADQYQFFLEELGIKSGPERTTRGSGEEFL